MHLGIGLSVVAEEMAADGYGSQVAIDYCDNVIETMKEKFPECVKQASSLTWRQLL